MATNNQSELDKKILSTLFSFSLASLPFCLAGLEIWSFSKQDTSVFYLVLKHIDIINLLLTSLFLLLPVFLVILTLVFFGKIKSLKDFLPGAIFYACLFLIVLLHLIHVPLNILILETVSFCALIVFGFLYHWKWNHGLPWKESLKQIFIADLYQNNRKLIIITIFIFMTISSVLIQNTDLFPKEIVSEAKTSKPEIHKGYVIGEEGKFTVVLQNSSTSDSRYEVVFIDTDKIVARSYEQRPTNVFRKPILSTTWLRKIDFLF